MKKESIFITYKTNNTIYKLHVEDKQYFQNEHLIFQRYSEGDLNKSIKRYFIEPKKQIELVHFEIIEYYNYSGKRVLIHGLQSWADSKEIGFDEKIKKLSILTKKYKLKECKNCHFFNNKGKKGIIHSYMYTYILNSNKIDDTYLIGSTDETLGYTIIEMNANKSQLKIIKDVKGLVIDKSTTISEIIKIRGDKSKIQRKYFDIISNKSEGKNYLGWTSFNKCFTNITEKIIIENLEAFIEKKIPIDVFQIDDGYQKSVGDWLIFNNKFPNGLKNIVNKIHKSNYKAGLWLAPFICEENSNIYINHRDWLFTDDNNKPIIAGYNTGWGSKFYTLNFYKTEVKNYLKKVFDTIVYIWGFDFVKLDYLYAAGLRSYNGKSRAMVMNDAIKLIQELIKDKLILGCGVPIASAINKLDYCRVCADVAPYWEMKVLKRFGYRKRISIVASLHSTIYRYNFNEKGFINNPDTFNLQDKNHKLLPEQKYTLFMLNNIFGGMIFTSDNINNYNEKTINLYKSSFPKQSIKIKSVIENNDCYKIKIQLNNKTYIILTNLTSRLRKLELLEGVYFDKERKNVVEILERNKKITLKPFETRCYYEVADSDLIIGTDGYILPCGEIKEYNVSEDKILNISLKEKFINDTNMYIRNIDLNKVLINDKIYTLQEINQFYSLLRYKNNN